ncbi:MAG: HD domain-containing protein [Proteobacteria bacterium]|nr:HD domain-containing protein [Pseudomonadota bacterium]
MSDTLSRAADFARNAHAGQSRKGAAKEPYITHVEEVAAFVTRHGGDEVAIAAA